MGNRGPNFAVVVARVRLDQSGSVHVTEEREVFRDEKYGMPTFGYGNKPLLWINNSVLLFGTEALSGWTHAVTLDIDRLEAEPQEIRPGDCEDSDWQLAPGGLVYIANNCQELDAHGLERIHTSTSKHEVVVPSSDFTISGIAGIHKAFAVLSNHLAYLQASHKTPYAVHVLHHDAHEARTVTSDSNFKSSAVFVKPKVVTFPSSDGRFILHGQLFLPTSNTSSEGLPGVVYTHGGSERQSYPAFHFDPVYANHFAVNQWLRYRGFAVLSINYRSGTGYGHDFRVCEKCMSFGAEEYLDVRTAALWLADLPQVSSNHVGIWGLSYGGLNALQACARDSAIFKACVAISGMFNWISSSRYFTDTGLKVIDNDIQPSLPKGFRMLDVGPEPSWADPLWFDRVRKRQEVAFQSSPAGHVANWTSPTLIIHGDADEEVDFQEAIGCVRKFRAMGRGNIHIKIFPDESHGCLAVYEHLLSHTEATVDFLEHHIGTFDDTIENTVV